MTVEDFSDITKSRPEKSLVYTKKGTGGRNNYGRVTVRARGVMEKCSFCVQRLQAGKLKAKTEGRKLQDSDVKVACQEACPAGCITFGDLNDPESAVHKLFKAEHGFQVLEEIKVLPNISYLFKVRNQPGKQAAPAPAEAAVAQPEAAAAHN